MVAVEDRQKLEDRGLVRSEATRGRVSPRVSAHGDAGVRQFLYVVQPDSDGSSRVAS